MGDPKDRRYVIYLKKNPVWFKIIITRSDDEEGCKIIIDDRCQPRNNVRDPIHFDGGGKRNWYARTPKSVRTLVLRTMKILAPNKEFTDDMWDNYSKFVDNPRVVAAMRNQRSGNGFRSVASLAQESLGKISRKPQEPQELRRQWTQGELF